MKPTATDPDLLPRSLDPPTFRSLIESALQLLERRAEAINDLNVFPVPDGDTGTNMLLTLQAAARAMRQLDRSDVPSLADALAAGALMGSRGNSGVLLSQFWRGFADGLRGANQVDGVVFAGALETANRTARAAVTDPVEGTILTVARDMARAASDRARSTSDLGAVLKQTVEEGRESVARTRELMPRLREAGVVDAGGLGLLTLLEGMYYAFIGEDLPSLDPTTGGKPVAVVRQALLYGYCTEFLLHGDDVQVERIRTDLSALGDSLLVVGDAARTLARVHVHTQHPGQAIEAALTYGEVDNVKIENMEKQVGRPRDRGSTMVHDAAACGLVVVAVGSGFTDLFSSLGATVIPGGETLNPSTEEIVHGLQRGASRQYVILPNSPNVLLAAKTASLAWDNSALVVPSRDLAEGVAAAVAFQSDLSAEENAAAMNRAIAAVKTGLVAEAHRGAALDDHTIAVGDVVGFVRDHIRVVGKDRVGVVFQLLDLLGAREAEVISIYPGEDATLAEAEAVRERIAAAYTRQQVDLVYGGQPHYSYILACE